jgi:CheY-like chemotaxis protein/HPt (histidine-containing phosphotransfer) domain-containing protein
VLVVDDNSVNQKVAARMLAKLGCTVEVAAHGREALEMVMQTPYAVVFMDCMMPEMDGYEATGAIRKLDGPAARTPIIAMTANAMQGDRERCLAAGMDDYLSKPVQPELLRQALERWGARGRSTEPGTAPPVDPNVLEAFRQLQEEGGPDVVTELIDLFLADLPARREAIIRSLSERDTGRTRTAAHSLKSSATYIGAQELARICRDLEAAARRGDTESCIRGGVTLEQEAERVTRYLHSARPGAAS